MNYGSLYFNFCSNQEIDKPNRGITDLKYQGVLKDFEQISESKSIVFKNDVRIVIGHVFKDLEPISATNTICF